MKTPRWLCVALSGACFALWLEHVAMLSIHLRESPTQFRDPKNFTCWGALFLLCLAATLAVALARRRRILCYLIGTFLLLHVVWMWERASPAFGHVEEFPYLHFTAEDFEPGEEIPPPVQVPYPSSVTVGIPVYAAFTTSLWFLVGMASVAAAVGVGRTTRVSHTPSAEEA